jgi:hypothetical protein
MDNTITAKAGVLDRFMPEPDIRERHEVRVHAPAEVTYREAMAFDLESLVLVRAILRGREILMGSKPVEKTEPMSFIARTRSMGWERFAEEPGSLYISGATCQPWLADVVFLPLHADDFALYQELNRVKIVWSVETASLGPDRSSLATETRAAATDDEARRKFLPYFRRVRPGIVAIRWLLLGAIRRRAETAWKRRRDPAV